MMAKNSPNTAQNGPFRGVVGRSSRMFGVTCASKTCLSALQKAVPGSVTVTYALPTA